MIMWVTVTLLIIVTFLCFWRVRKWHKSVYPRNPFVSPQYKGDVNVSDEDVEISKVMSRRNVPEEVDVIVIGSGVSGLGMGALMSKCGKRVLVLEQHDRCGGSMHSFEESGFQFDTGVHYVADMKDGCYSRVLLDCLCDEKTQWSSLSKDAFDRVLLGPPGNAKSYDMSGSGKDSFRDKLVEYFPEDVQAIDTYLQKVRSAARGVSSTIYVVMTKLMPWWLAAIVRFFAREGRIFATTSLETILDQITRNKELKAVLSYCHPDYGSNPRHASFYVHSLITHYFLENGADYPVGGTTPIIKKLVKVIKKGGGDCLVRAKVKEILVSKENKVIGVQMERDGIVIKSPVVISSAGVRNTFGRMLPARIRRSYGLDEKLESIKPSYAFFSVFVAYQGSPKELGFEEATNLWIYPKANVSNIEQYDYEQVYDKYFNSDGEMDPSSGVDIPMLYVTCQSSKDPQFQMEHPNSTCFTILIPSNYKWFSEWSDTKVHHRTRDYLELKQGLLDRTLELFTEYYPSLKDKLIHASAGTPLTTNHYLNVEHGECYGSMDNDINRFKHTFAKPATPIDGLYLTGQDLLAAGWTSALITVLMTGSAILGRLLFRDLAVPLAIARNPVTNYKKT